MKKIVISNGLLFGFLAFATSLFSQAKLEDATPKQHTTSEQDLVISVLNDHGQLDTINLSNIIKGLDRKSSFLDQHGETINYLTFQDKVVLIDFWFLNCKPCIVELPGLELLNKKIRSDDFEVLTFANDPMEKIQEKLLSKKAFDFRVVAQTFLVRNKMYPLKILVNKKGEVIHQKSGGNTNSKSIERLLETYLPLVKTALGPAQN